MSLANINQNCGVFTALDVDSNDELVTHEYDSFRLLQKVLTGLLDVIQCRDDLLLYPG